MNTTQNTYKLYSDIVPVKGYSRSILFDLTKQNYFYIPNELYEIIQHEIDFLKLAVKFPNDSKNLNEYEKFLRNNDLIFPLNLEKMESFPKINLCWQNSNKITNMIFDIEENTSIANLIKLDNEVGNLGVEALLIRCFNTCSLSLVKDLVSAYANSLFNSLKDIQLDIVYQNDYEKNFIKMINEISLLAAVSSINIYSVENINSSKFKTDKVSIIQKKIINHKNCGVIYNNMDSIDINLISESQQHNSCLNRKLSVDYQGNIKNCPSMSQNYGNINDITLEEALDHEDFKKYWNLPKDKIEICKDCEFRYICTDCRAYTERTHINDEGLDISKPLKCGYDPYTGEWQEWSKNPLKQKAINYYGINEILL